MGYNKKEKKLAEKKVKSNHLRKKWLIFVLFFLSTLFIAAILYIFLFSNKPVQEIDLSDIKQQLDAEVQKNGVSSGQSFLDKKLQATVDSKVKSSIYIEKALLSGASVGNNDYSKALEYAYQAEQYEKTKQSAYTIAFYEEKLGNIENATKYYQLYLDRLSDNEEDTIDYEYYSAYVKSLRPLNEQE